MKARRQQCWTVPKDRQRAGGEQAFVLPLVIPAALLLLMGATTLMSRTANSYLVATKQSDAQLAREAAESGMNRVLSGLNPYAKYITDPYVSFLLASRWEADRGVQYNTGVAGSPAVRSGWRLTTLGQSTVVNLLKQCGFSEHGQHPNQVPPNSTDVYKNLLSGAIGASDSLNGTQLRYMVTDYVPPVQPNPSDWPTECSDFTSLSGGSAQISVEGRVIRNGKLVSRYTLTRTIDVLGWPLVNLPASWFPSAMPGPPVGLRIGGTATSLAKIQSGFYKIFSESSSYTDLKFGQSLPMCRNQCPNGWPYDPLQLKYPTIETRPLVKTEIIPAKDIDLPRYPYNTSKPPSGILPRQINESRANYPYVLSGNTSTSNLFPECRHSLSLDSNRPRGSRLSEIDCWIDSIGVPQEVSSVGYDKTTNVFTITLRSNARYDVQTGTRLKVEVKTGSLASAKPWKGTVISSAGSPQVITFTPDLTPDPPPPNTVSAYSTAATPSTNATFVSPDTTASNPLTLRVNTEARPVNLIIRGNVGTSAPSDFVVIKHLVKESPAQVYVHQISPDVNVRNAWSRLRLFGLMPSVDGLMPPPDFCPSTPVQTFYIRPDPISGKNGEESSLGGAFLWLPQGSLVYGTVGQLYPKELLTVWWLCHLDIVGLSGQPSRMVFITPLIGNPEVVEALLPGGYQSASGDFIPDLRFPVYPSLQRIKSTF